MKNLKKLREERGLSQQNLAEKIGISQQSIYKYENKKAEPDISTIIKLADFFGCTVDYLIGKTDADVIFTTEISGNNQSMTSIDLYYLNLFKRVSSEAQKAIILLLEQLQD